MGWTCFGFLDQCRIGTKYFRSSTDGLCLSDADQERYDGVAPFQIVFCIIRGRSHAHPHRHVTAWRDGTFMWIRDMPDGWDHMELTYDLTMEGIWEFKLQDSDTSEVLCSIMIGFNKDPVFEEEIPDEDIGEDVIDYDRITERMIGIENDLMGKIKYIDLLNDYDRENNKNDIIIDIRNQGSVITTGLKGLQAGVSATETRLGGRLDYVSAMIRGAVSGVSDQIGGLGFPTLNSIKETFISAASEIADKILERVWDEIERRYEK